MEKDIMKYESTLPENFDGTFRFTNWTNHDFVAKWGGKEYHFPANSTSPIVMFDQTPLEIQQIRKKFAKNLAEQEFYLSEGYNKLLKQEKNDDGSPRLNSIHSAGTYSIDQLAPFIQRCLEPLPVSQAIVVEAEKKNIEDVLTKNEEGELNTQALDRKTSLRKKALES